MADAADLGVALAEAVGEVTGVRASLKWPNDLLAGDGRKLAGILAESSGTAVVVGVGLNVSTTAAELPDTGTSLARRHRRGRRPRAAAARLAPRRGAALPALDRGARRPGGLRSGADYLAWCSTVGTTVVVTLPDGSTLEGVAEAVDWDGRLVVGTPEGRVELASGDVRHVRPAR